MKETVVMKERDMHEITRHGSHIVTLHLSMQDILLRRAADVLEAFYTLPKSQQTPTGPLNHISPGLYYCGPKSPALFPAIFTQQGAFKQYSTSSADHLCSGEKDLSA